MKKQVEFLNRLFDLLKCRSSLLEYLKEEKLITQDIVQALLTEHQSSHAAKIIAILTDLHKNDKLQLVDFEWTILPYEHLKLTLISHSGKKEFEYNA